MEHRRPSRIRQVLLIAIPITTATLLLAWRGWAWSGSQRTELAQWIMATSSVVTLVAAVSAAVYAAGAFHLEFQREDRWAETTRREQARLIAAWPTGTHNVDPDGQVDAVAIEVRNGSEVPVYEVLLTVWVRVPGDDRILPARTSIRATHQMDVLAPGGNEQIWVEIPLVDRLPGAPTETRVTLQFRDAAGLHWFRLEDGALIDGS